MEDLLDLGRPTRLSKVRSAYKENNGLPWTLLDLLATDEHVQDKVMRELVLQQEQELEENSVYTRLKNQFQTKYVNECDQIRNFLKKSSECWETWVRDSRVTWAERTYNNVLDKVADFVEDNEDIKYIDYININCDEEIQRLVRDKPECYVDKIE